jgi:excisionase family DNA binding protein
MNLISVSEAAKRLRVSASFLYGKIASGELKHYRLGHGQGGIRISDEQLAEFLSAREAGGDPSPESRIPLRDIRPAKG